MVCADTTAPDGDDIQLLKRRFKAFVGVSFREEVSIENGIGRLDLPDQLTTEQEIVNLNNRMLAMQDNETNSKKNGDRPWKVVQH